MRYALIGCGRIATNHIKAVLNNGLELAAVCDIIPEQMESLLAKHGLETRGDIKRYTDYKKMLEENALELVAIATQSGPHAPIALDCIDRGINVIIEKPMAMNMAAPSMCAGTATGIITTRRPGGEPGRRMAARS